VVVAVGRWCGGGCGGANDLVRWHTKGETRERKQVREREIESWRGARVQERGFE